MNKIEHHLSVFFEKSFIFSKLKLIINWMGVLIITLGLMIIIGNYIFSIFQPFRGPSKLYFWLFLFVSFLSTRSAIGLLAFSLPLMPGFHTQLELVTNPAVKYFFVYSGIDAAVGLIIGYQLNRWIIKRKINLVYGHLPWPLGLFLIVLLLSTCLAISRNLWQSAFIFSYYDLLKNIFSYKLINHTSDYLPIADMLVFVIGIGLVSTFAEKLRYNDDKNLIVIKPLVISLLISGCLGVIQAFTAFGLNSDALSTRKDFFGFGAIGFQPDIHAYAGLMCIGAVGIIAILKFIDSKVWRIIFIATIAISWLAIILSKSRASFFLALGMALVLLFLNLKVSKKNKIIIYIFLSVGLVIFFILIKNHSSILNLYELYNNDKALFLEKLNLISSWRLDLHTATIRMWSQFPLMGIGLGDLQRVSSVYDFSGSALMPREGGDNSHNYFLQLLAEIGIVGFASFFIILVWPLFIVAHSNKMRTVYVVITALFLGNIYSHSFIIRENLYLLMILVGVIYAYLPAVSEGNNKSSLKKLTVGWILLKSLFSIFLCVVFAFAIGRETSRAYTNPPFKYAQECYRASKISNNGWSKGRYVMELPERAKGISLIIQLPHEVSDSQHLPARFELFDRSRNIVATEYKRVDKKDTIVLEIYTSNGKPIGPAGGVGVVSLYDCLNTDTYEVHPEDRVLSLTIKEVQVLY